MRFCFWGGTAVRRSESASMADWCVFCPIARRNPTSNTVLLYSDDRVVAFQDINPSASRHYLVIPIEHIPTVNYLQKSREHHQLVSHMVKVGKDLLNRDAPNSEEHRYSQRLISAIFYISVVYVIESSLIR
ncbi:hypothetical protein GUJ93_ZPchr0004g40037 [Zizania palustris]|uniref:HIT domain-containing protein n=1 Tax=Zizania palustris TaxID=103762 RepID=A0A8J5T034_ZIZPA|nr:hypothetical protein GUJ93_ZPchr0004g40037 [Zizania palustris]